MPSNRPKTSSLERLVGFAKKIKIGPGLDETVDMGPAVDESQWKTDFDYIEMGKNEGARLVVGGGKPKDVPDGYYVEPTIFDRSIQECVSSAKRSSARCFPSRRRHHFEEAIQFANSVEYGLTTSIFTRDIDSHHAFHR